MSRKTINIIKGNSILFLKLCFCVSCLNSENKYIEYAFEVAGANRSELETVLNHYNDDQEKHQAALFLIKNMPGHYSYRGGEIDNYYEIALNLFSSELTPKEQRDSLLFLSDNQFASIGRRVIQDAKIISSVFLINNINKAFDVWRNERWAKHLTFEEFCEWLLPYKCSELQQLDEWRDTLSYKFSDDIRNIIHDDESYNSPFRAVNVIRQEISRKIKPVGMYNRSGYPMLSAETMSNMTFGLCADYVNLAVLTYRSLGIPVIIDETPLWGRYRAGHSWYTLLNDRGDELKSEWDISSSPGGAFFPYQRIPKIYRCTYAINRERVKYMNKSIYKHPFNLFQVDVTDKYFKTSDIIIPIKNNIKLKEKYVYIAAFSGHNIDWFIVDYGNLKRGKAYFNKIGRNVLYLAMGYDGRSIIPISEPFILHRDGSIEYINVDPFKTRSINVRRKYYSSENVVAMRQRIIGGKIQAANHPDFLDAITLYRIDSLTIPDKIRVNIDQSYQYWRYLSSDGTYSSIAELAFFDSDSMKIYGVPIACPGVEEKNILNAFDDDWLSYFEINKPNGGWVGVDFGKKISVEYIRIVPRGDDNDIHPGDEYELRFWDGKMWITLDIRKATDNYLLYNNIPEGALLWIHNRTRGWDERVFIMRDHEIEWW